jgi:predicted transcriptional regulator
MARTVRLSPEAETKLTELASQMGQSKNSVIEMAVLELDARTIRRERVRRAFDRVRDRDAELLDRLSQ